MCLQVVIRDFTARAKGVTLKRNEKNGKSGSREKRQDLKNVAVDMKPGNVCYLNHTAAHWKMYAGCCATSGRPTCVGNVAASGNKLQAMLLALFVPSSM